MSIFFRFSTDLPSWAEILTFGEGNTTYTANSSHYYLYVNTNGQNVTITLPSNTAASRAFNLRKINDSVDILTIVTDSDECDLDGNTSLSTNSILNSLSVVMGLDGNFWSTGGGGGGASVDLTYYVNTAQLSTNLSNYSLISFVTGNYTNTVQLSANLTNYPNTTQLTNNLALYATNTYLTTNFPNNSQLSSNIVNFITGAQLSGNLTATNTYLTTNYPNNTQLSANLGSYTLTSFVSGNYPNNTQLSNNLVPYATNTYLTTNFPNTTQLTSNLANYPNTTQLTSNLANYPNTTQLTSNLANYQSTIIANSGIVSNSTGLFVNANNGLLANSTGLFVIANTGISANSSGIFSTVTGTPGGANTQIQYNNSGAFGACANLTFNGTILSLGNGSVNVTINSTTFSGTSLTANNATNLGGTIASGYQTTAGLSANVATLTANSSSYVGTLIASNVVSNAQLSGNLGAYQTTAGLSANVATLSANNSSYLGTVAAASYQQTGTPLVNNVATLTANSASYVGALIAVNVVSNAQLSGNLGAYQTTAGLASNVAILTANNSSFLGTVAAASYQQTGTPLTNNVATLTANNSTYLGGVTSGSYINTSGNYVITGNHTYGNATVNLVINSTALLVGAINTSAVGISVANNLLTIGNSSVNVTANSTTFSGIALTANNATNLGGTAAAGYQTTAGLSANVATLTANNSTNLGGTAAAGYQTTAGLSSNVATLSANNSSYLGTVAAASYQQTGAPLTNNVATLTANNSSYLGGVVSTSYVNTSGNYVITGVHTYGNLTVNSVINSTAYLIGAINSTAVGLSLANNLITLGNSSVNATINSTTFSGISLTANNATNLGGTAAAGYQTTAGLSANVATLSANNSSYLGTVAAASYQQTGAPLTNNVATLTANNSTYLGGVTSGSYINTSGSYVITGVHTYGNLTVNSVINSTAHLIGAINSTAVGLSLANNLLTIGNSSVNATINSTAFSGIVLTANSASYAGSLIASNVVSNAQLSANLGAYQTSAGLATNVANYAAFGFRNRFFNGDMRIDQRNVGAAYTNANGTNSYICDRIYVFQTGNTMSAQRISNYATTPNPYALQITGKASINNFVIGQRVEAMNIFDTVGSNVTFQCKISSTSAANVNWRAYYPSTLENFAGGETCFANGIFTISSTPTVYVSNFTVNAACGNGMSIELWAGGTGTFTSGTLTTTDWQLELSSIATPFERRPICVELPMCQRYFAKSYNQTVAAPSAVSGGAGGIMFVTQGPAASCGSYFKYPITMRISSGLSIYDNAGTADRYTYYSSGWQNGAQGALVGSFDHGFNWQANGASVQVAFNFDYIANAEIY